MNVQHALVDNDIIFYFFVLIGACCSQKDDIIILTLEDHTLWPQIFIRLRDH